MGEWTIEYEGDRFEKFFLGLPEYEQAVLEAAITHVLAVRGIDICNGEWGKPLGEGLYEFRVRRSLQAILTEAGVPLPEDLRGADRQVLLRVLCAFRGNKIVLLYSGYDKQRDPSAKRQAKEITARAEVASCREEAPQGLTPLGRVRLIWVYTHRGGVPVMARSFADLASRAKESWSGDAHQVNEAASKVFKAEVSAQEALGTDLTDARHGLNITQKVLSERSGVPQSEISRIESGRANPTIETLARLATALDKKLVLQ